MEGQAPSVGRIVHYVAYGTPGGEFPAGVCRAAIITEIEAVGGEPDPQGFVSLAVLNPTGLFFNPRVAHAEGEMVHGELVHDAGTWHWPERV